MLGLQNYRKCELQDQKMILRPNLLIIFNCFLENHRGEHISFRTLCGTYNFSPLTLDLKDEPNPKPGKTVTPNTGSFAIPNIEEATAIPGPFAADRAYCGWLQRTKPLTWTWKTAAPGIRTKSHSPPKRHAPAKTCPMPMTPTGILSTA